MTMQNVLSPDKDIHYGEVVRHWRKEVVGCPLASLLEVYNETFGTDYSRRWWERMEKDNKLPADIDRRLVIAAMLNIPFADLGLRFPPTEKKQLLIPFLTGKTVIDVSEYRNLLARLWSPPRYEKAEEAIYRVNLLEDALHYGPQSERSQVAELLGEYLIFWSNVERDSAHFSSAVNMANKAIRVATARNMPYLAAKAYYMRGSAIYDSWPASSQRNPDALTRIITDIGKASTFLKEAKRGGVLEAAILEFWGGAAISQAQDLSDKKLNLKKLDLAVKVLESAPQDPFFFKIDHTWLQIGHAEALIGAKWPQSALADLGKFPSGDAKKLRRFLTAAIVEAEAYRAMDKIDVAVAHASAALETAKKLRADLHIARIDALYRDMRSEEKYKGSTELMILGIEIVKAQYPQFFCSKTWPMH